MSRLGDNENQWTYREKSRSTLVGGPMSLVGRNNARTRDGRTNGKMRDDSIKTNK